MDIDFKKLKLNNGKTIEQQLKSEAQRFIDILQEEIDDWYNLYSPKMYHRTRDMRNSIYAEDIVDVSISGTQLNISVKYSNSAYHKSLWGDDEADTLMLMNSGYQVSKGWHKNIENFGYREGGHFLEKAIYRFNKENYLGLKLHIDYK